MPTTPGRLGSIDAIRGTVMVIMALDHIRDFLHRGAMQFNPADLSRTTPLLFLTRWITHFCAPVFVFTAGIGAFLWWQRGRTRAELSVFLLTRGLWLVVLELTVMRLGYYFNYSLRYPVLLVVLWVIGVCMIGMAALVWLPIRVLAVLSVATIALHNCLDAIDPSRLGAWAGVWNVLHQPGRFAVGGVLVGVSYTVVPWIAVMAAGFCCGNLFLMAAAARRRILLATGAACCFAFLALRGVNWYGDPAPWSVQGSAVFTVLSFLNCTKYPPSLAFLLMTLGPALLVLAWFDRLPWTPANPLVVFGRVPLFYFIAHFYIAHLTAAVLACLRYGSKAWTFLFVPMPSLGGPAKLFPPGFGWDLWVVYAVWVSIVVGLYPACRWFAGIKARRHDWWLSYL